MWKRKENILGMHGDRHKYCLAQEMYDVASVESFVRMRPMWNVVRHTVTKACLCVCVCMLCLIRKNILFALSACFDAFSMLIFSILFWPYLIFHCLLAFPILFSEFLTSQLLWHFPQNWLLNNLIEIYANIIHVIVSVLQSQSFFKPLFILALCFLCILHSTQNKEIRANVNNIHSTRKWNKQRTLQSNTHKHT